MNGRTGPLVLCIAMDLLLAGLAMFWAMQGLNKLSNRAIFEADLNLHELLPQVLTAVLPVVVGLGEISAGILLALALIRREIRPQALLWSVALLASFVAYLAAVAAIRGPHEHCACGGIIRTTALSGILRNSFAIVLLGLCLYWCAHPRTARMSCDAH